MTAEIITALIVYSIVTTISLMYHQAKNDDDMFFSAFLNAIISFIIFLIVTGIIHIFIYFS